MATAEQLTVQVLPDAKKDGLSAVGDWFVEPGRADILPAWGTRMRERALRTLYRDPYNTLVQGLVQGQIKKVKGTPWEIVGGKTRTTYFSKVLREAQFGQGWGTFISLMLLDYKRHDIGAFAEVIAPGNPMRPPTGRVVGLAHLDAMNCYLTGDPEFPVIYMSKDGKNHLMHHTRVLHWVDMPDGDSRYHGVGLSALSRAVAVVERQILMSRYIRIKLDDDPPPGMITASNMSRVELERARAQYTSEMSNDARPPWGKIMWFFGMNPQEPAELKVVAFNETPDGFDYPKYMDIDVNQLALAFGVDKQELWELNGVNVGSATQSVILDAKSKGKSFGDDLTMIERDLNRLFPEDIDFKWKVKDTQEQETAANIAQVWVGVGKSLQEMGVPSDIWTRILANQVSAIADAVIDVDGNLIRMNDVDPEAPDTGTVPVEDVNTQNDVTDRSPGLPGETGAKDISDTKAQFEDAFTFVLENARKEVYGKVRLRSIMMNLIREYGYKAYADGKQEGGVDEPLTDAEEAEALTLLAGQRGYVNSFVDRLLDTGITDASATEKPEMWFTKSIQVFQYAGRNSVDANGLYVFGGKDGMETCPTCQTLKGQSHRLDQWTKARLRPGVDTDRFECRGFRCQHTLTRTTGRPRGRLPTMKEMEHVH